MSLELRAITKRFGSVVANDTISLSVGPGEIHGLLGENGAGKSTLVKILSGFITRDHGEIELDGAKLHLLSPNEAVANGIGILHQEPLVFLPFSVVDNFLIGSPKEYGHAEAYEALLRISEQFGFDLNPDVTASNLSIGERQQLEIARLLWLGARVLILDEPTTAISSTQREKLFATIRDLAGNGMSVIFVSHKLEEVQELCDRVTILREGKIAASVDLPSPVEYLVSKMFATGVLPETRRAKVNGSSLLELVNASASEQLGQIIDANLAVTRGQVIGLAGLEGAGQRTLLRAMAGFVPFTEGSFRVQSAEISELDYLDRLGLGFYYLPADRLREGLVNGLSITEHVALSVTDQSKVIDWNVARSEAARRIDKFSIKGTVESTPESLSGGNQQRLLLALMPEAPLLLLMEHPTRGLDIESATWVWSYLLTLSESGTSIIFSSSDLEELTTYSDQIAVFFSGRIIDQFDASEATVEELGLLIGGIRRR
ncbi:MAG: ATP-binding cassette domain-containing protein [Chloroflexota bacterium]|nr:ATP-binding cassette domain-containing protein [Chloroflexota bacterium]